MKAEFMAEHPSGRTYRNTFQAADKKNLEGSQQVGDSTDTGATASAKRCVADGTEHSQKCSRLG